MQATIPNPDEKLKIGMIASLKVPEGAAAGASLSLPLTVKELITRRIEEKIAENPRVERIDSNTRSGVAVVTILLSAGRQRHRQGGRPSSRSTPTGRASPA